MLSTVALSVVAQPPGPPDAGVAGGEQQSVGPASNQASAQSVGQKSVGQKSVGQKSVGQKSVGQKSVGQGAAGQNSGDGAAPSGGAEVPTARTVAAVKGGDPRSSAPSSDPSVTPEAAPSRDDSADVSALQTRAEHLQALAQGTLDPRLDAAHLLEFDLLSPAFGAAELKAAGGLRADDQELSPRLVRAQLASAAAESAAAVAAAEEGTLAYAQARLRAAVTAFLRLPAAQRASRLADHEVRRRAYLALSEEVEALRAQKVRLAEHFRRAQAYLAGTLSPTLRPDGLLVVNLVEERRRPEKPAKKPQAGRRRAPKVAPAPSPEAELLEERARLWTDIDELSAGLQTLSVRYSALSPADRAALRATHERRVQAYHAERQARAAAAVAPPEPVVEPVAAALAVQSADAELAASEAQRNAALQAAERARTQAQRMLAQEKARVLGRKTELNKLRLQIAEELSVVAGQYDEAFGLVSRARELQQRSVLDGAKGQDATRLYGTLRAALSDYRTQLSSALGAVVRRESRLPEPLTPLDERFLKEIEDPELGRLRRELAQLRGRLADYEAQVAWERATKLRDVVTHLNDARLSLLREATADTRSRVRGFGPDGVGQARSEAEHMLLMVRYHVLSLPQQLASLQQQARRASIMILFSLVQIMLLLVVYRQYRKRADGVLERAYRQTVQVRGAQPSLLSRLQARALWYLRRVHKPLGAWLFAALMFRYLEDLDLPEIDFLWIVLLWYFAGSTAVQLLDAFADRQNMLMRNWHDDPRLRRRSLRLLAFVFWGGGLLLSLTERSVGEGTIYAWTLSLLWFALLPVGLLLVWWWRERIREWVAKSGEQSGLLSWVQQRIDGPMALIGLTVAGFYWISSGGVRWLMRWLAGFELSQRVTAYLFRSQVQRSAKGQDAASTEQCVPDGQYASFDLTNAEVPLVEDIGAGVVQQMEALLREPGALVVLVGDRGMGKSTTLRRLAAQVGADCTLILRVGSNVHSVRHDLAQSLGLGPAAEPSQLAQALVQRGVRFVLLDNLQMLIRPDVFGLREFDLLSALLHPLRAVASVVLTCSTPAYEVLARARPDAGIDRVLRLPRLTRVQVTQLIKSRCAAEKIKPSYDSLVVPRTFDLEGDQHEDPLEAGFFRILWDYADGNPAVALFFFRRSLCTDTQGRLVVVLFSTPSATELDALPRPVPFVLRTLMQLTEGDVSTVAACSNLPEAQTRDWVELGLRRGYLEVVGQRVRISWLWFRAVRTLLRRQHLLS